MSELMKITDEGDKQKKKNKDRKTQKKGASYSEKVRAKWLCCMLGFLQLICKASLICKSNLELAISIILKERELSESKNVMVECRCLKICNLLSFLICSSILVLK